MKLLKPDLVIDRLSELDLNLWREKGIRCLFIDLDNTIAPWRQNSVTKEAKAMIAGARELGIMAVLFTNAGESRVREIAWGVGTGYYHSAKKPFQAVYRKAMAELELDKKQVMTIGDQIFTDVLGGNLAGCVTVLTSPLAEREYKGTKILRFLERRIGRKAVFLNRREPGESKE